MNFLWNGLRDVVKFHLMDWNTVYSSIACLGLGVHQLGTFNRALLGEWLCHFGQCGDGLLH